MAKNSSKYPLQQEVLNAIQEQETGLSNPGFCLACGEQNDGCEPDAENYLCEFCDEEEVFGAEQILLMSAYREG